MENEINFGTSEQAVLVPLRLPDSQHESRRLQGWNVGGLVCGIGDYEQDVDEGLAARPGTDVDPISGSVQVNPTPF